MSSKLIDHSSGNINFGSCDQFANLEIDEHLRNHQSYNSKKHRHLSQSYSQHYTPISKNFSVLYNVTLQKPPSDVDILVADSHYLLNRIQLRKTVQSIKHRSFHPQRTLIEPLFLSTRAIHRSSLLPLNTSFSNQSSATFNELNLYCEINDKIELFNNDFEARDCDKFKLVFFILKWFCRIILYFWLFRNNFGGRIISIEQKIRLFGCCTSRCTFCRYESAILHGIRLKQLSSWKNLKYRLSLSSGMIGKKNVFRRDLCCCLRFTTEPTRSRNKFLAKKAGNFMECLMQNIQSQFMDLSLFLLFLSLILNFINITLFQPGSL